MAHIYYKKDFDNMSKNEIDKWIEVNQVKLVGSAVFTQSESIISKLVSWAEKVSSKEESEDFIPSHTGSIIKTNNEILLFNMKPPRASAEKLSDYIYNTKDEFVIVLRGFKLNTKMFSINIEYHIGQWYPYMSALRSVLTKRPSPWSNHCSELHAIELAKQDILPKNINLEITPFELLELLSQEQY